MSTTSGKNGGKFWKCVLIGGVPGIMQINNHVFTKLFKWFKRKISILQQQESTKCPHCGNAVELLLPRMEFDDPLVYKCTHCQCTITCPGTSTITETGRLMPYWSNQENIISLRSGEIKFTGKIYKSVGWEYDIIYPEDSFKINRNITYCHPEMMKAGMNGGDEATVEYTLKPLKTGLFCITEEIQFRGNLEECIKHYFLVE